MLTENTITHLNPEDVPGMTEFIIKKLPYDLSFLLCDSSRQKTCYSFNGIYWLVVIF